MALSARARLNAIACALLEALPEEGMGEGPLATFVSSACGGDFTQAVDDVGVLVSMGLLEREPGHLIRRGPRFADAAEAYARHKAAGGR